MTNWLIGLVVLIAFVWVGGFHGFIAWAVLTALTLYWQAVRAKVALKAAELELRAEENRLRQAPPPALEPPPPKPPEREPRHLSTRDDGSVFDLRTMTYLRSASFPEPRETHLIRRISPTQWEWKQTPNVHKQGLDVASMLLADDKTHEQLRAAAQTCVDKYSAGPIWEPLPEEYIAPLETQYQRYLAHGG